MRVLVTGHRGYLGAVLTEVLRHARFDVTGLDCDLYAGCDFGRTREPVPAFDFDLRTVEFTDLLPFDAVVHLAALPDLRGSGLAPSLTEQVNVESTLRLAACCRKADVGRFVFASSCAVYGRGGAAWLDEDQPPAPITRYAASKLACERELARLADSNFVPVMLRMGTLFGMSPRLRLDTVINEFVGAAVVQNRINMHTAGNGWRPFLHVEDAARGFAAVLTAPDDTVRDGLFNLVATTENYRVIEAADMVTEEVPGGTRLAAEGVPDEQSYRVRGARFARTFPQWSTRWTLRNGIRQLRTALAGGGLTPADWRGDRYRRLPHLMSRLERGTLDADLRTPVEALEAAREFNPAIDAA